MRLIDADKLMRKSCAFGVRKSCESCREVKTIPNITCDEIRFDFLSMIDNEFTVKAIPVEWIEKQIEKALSVDSCDTFYATHLKYLIKEWRELNEQRKNR